MEDLTKKGYKKYKSQPRKLPLDEEHKLIKAAQDGNREASEKLLKTYDFFIVSVARKVAYQTGASKNLEDLAQVGRMALYEKIFTYNFKHKSRLTSYAYREITHRMFQEACDFLEIVPLTKKFELHQAHKELDSRGFTPEAIKDVASRYSLSENVINSLQRKTISFEGFAETFIDNATPEQAFIDSEEHEETTSKAWNGLNSTQRMVLAMLYVSNSIRVRTKVFRLKPKELKLVELCAKRKLLANLKKA